MKTYSIYSYTTDQVSSQVRNVIKIRFDIFAAHLTLNIDSQEIATLIVKSLFPIHPIAAAIQSIYVCRRDLEGDVTIGLGRTLLPSIFLRGTYEFALSMIGWSSQRGYNNFYQEDHVTGIALLSFCVSILLVVSGGCFYRHCSKAQYARLRDESEAGDGNAPDTSFGLMV